MRVSHGASGGPHDVARTIMHRITCGPELRCRHFEKGSFISSRHISRRRFIYLQLIRRFRVWFPLQKIRGVSSCRDEIESLALFLGAIN
jgi:hypothetical protein